MTAVFEESQKANEEMQPLIKTRSRWSRERAEAILKDWRSSGMSLRSYTREKGIGYQRLLSWRRKLSRGEAGDFVRINVHHERVPALEIVSSSGRTVRFHAGTDPEYIKSLLTVIES